MNKKIAVIDDEEDILNLIKLQLKKNNYSVSTFLHPQKFLKYLEKNLPDLIILDIMLPDIDGLEILKIIRQEKKTKHLPIIMLSAKSEEIDKILGLEFGADDYVTKPFSVKELLARIKALLRRTEKVNDEIILKIKDKIILNKDAREVIVKKKKIELTSSEFNILAILMESVGRVYSREEILNQVWGYEKAITDRTVDVHIRHLREKLGDVGKLIKNIRSIGYKIEAK